MKEITREQAIEIWIQLHGHDEAAEGPTLSRRQGLEFDPAIIDAIVELAPHILQIIVLLAKRA